MPVTRFGDPADAFFQLHPDSVKADSLEELFGDNEELFRGVDFSSLDIDDVDLSFFFATNCDSEDDSDGECPASRSRREIKNHDCMWGGQCCNKEFQRTQVPPPPPKPQAVSPSPVKPVVPATPPSVLITHSSQNKVVTIQKCVPGVNSDRTDVVVVTNNLRTPIVKSEGRSLLLNRTTQQAQNSSPVKIKTEIKREILTPQSSRPETPQSLSEDDDMGPVDLGPSVHNNTRSFHSALDVLTSSCSSTADWEDELMYGEVRRTKGECDRNHVPPPPTTQTELMRISAPIKNDHNYDVGSSKNFRLEGLGVDTPSDSEEDEEIDVVSLSERSSSSRSSSCSGGLPTRPTQRDQQHLEEITTSLLSASEAVSRKLKKTVIATHHQQQGQKYKRKKYPSESSEDDDDDDDDDDFDDTDDQRSIYSSKYHRQNKRQKPSSPGQSGRRKKSSRFGEEEDSQEKRDLHNNMERMRRIDLRNSFEELKALVPTVATKDRAAKVVILREASIYCGELGAESQGKGMQILALRKEQERLRAMVSSLRKAAAMACIKASQRT